ncbi:MAG: hypothetical protein CR974_02265 [Gammaproteobacteria bacterium]|nr:MAG: hypothetical protein CR974_02265 [Gammaproteobacteria bacterium]
MNIIVAVKGVIDSESDIQVSAGAVVSDNHATVINPFDEVALTAAVALKQAGLANEILAVSVGDSACQDVLNVALAIGADQALWVASDAPVASLTVAKTLAKIAEERQADLLLFGQQAIDSDAGQTGAMTAALLDWGQATAVSALTIDPDQQSVIATCDSDAGSETLSVKLPAVLTTTLRLNEPPPIRLSQWLAAKDKPLKQRPLSDLGIATTPPLSVQNLRAVSQHRKGVMLKDAAELANLLADYLPAAPSQAKNHTENRR